MGFVPPPRPLAVVTSERMLTDTEVQRIREQWEHAYTGPYPTGAPMGRLTPQAPPQAIHFPRKGQTASGEHVGMPHLPQERSSLGIIWAGLTGLLGLGSAWWLWWFGI